MVERDPQGAEEGQACAGRSHSSGGRLRRRPPYQVCTFRPPTLSHHGEAARPQAVLSAIGRGGRPSPLPRGVGPRARCVYPRQMPQPGDPYASAFVAEVDHCWRMVHDRQGQATHCREATTFTGRWYSPRDDGTYWRVWSCP